METALSKAPEEQTELFGHAAAEDILLDMWNKKKLAGSWLFCGPKGVGKATLAYRLARFILSQTSVSGQSGGGLFGEALPPTSLDVSEADAAFKAVAHRTHPALKVIECALKEDEIKDRQALLEAGKPLDPEVERTRKRYDEIRVSDIREAESFLHLTAAGSNWRIMIIDAADDMNKNAANALLKSLEEPPPQTIMILISHAPGRLLPTIRSRCRRLIFKPLKDDMLQSFLKQHRPELSEKECHSLTLLADGSAGQALSLADKGGLNLFVSLLELFSNFPVFSIPKLYDFVDKNLKEKDKLKTAQDLLMQWLARVCVLSQTNMEEAGEIFPNEKQLIQRVSIVIPPVELMDVLNEIRTSFMDIDLDRKQVFVNSFLKLQRGAAA